MSRMLIVAALAATVFAGCLSNEGPGFKSILDSAYSFRGDYNWHHFTVTDSSGAWLENISFANATDEPVGVQQILGRGGSDTMVAVTQAKTLFATTFDAIQRSTDSGRTWTVVHEFLTPDYPVRADRWQSNGQSLSIDPVDGTLYVANLYTEAFSDSWCMHLMRTKDEGATWNDKPLAYCNPGLDLFAAWIAAGPTSKTPIVPVPAPVRTDDENLYFCYKELNRVSTSALKCAASYDHGDTFAQHGYAELPVFIHCLIPSKPVITPDGVLTVPIANADIGWCPAIPPEVAVSNDNGFTWDFRPFPGSATNLDGAPRVAFTPDGTGYLAYRDVDQAIYVVRGRDHFQSWDGPYRVSPKDLTLTYLPSIAVGDDGRIAIAYLGTRQEQEPGASPEYASPASHWHLFVATTFNGESENPRFFTGQVTPQEDPIQVGCLASPRGSTGENKLWRCFNLGNGIDMTVDAYGRYMVGLTDGCNPRNGCTGDTDAGWTLKDRLASVVVQDRGRALRGDKILQSLDLHHPSLMPHGDGKI